MESFTFITLLGGYVATLAVLHMTLKSRKIPSGQPTSLVVPAGNTRVTYKHRDSHLDSTRSSFLQSEYRGFFNLIAMGMGFFVASHNVRHWLRTGTLVGLSSLAELFSRFEVFFLWLLFVFATFLSVVIQKLFVKCNLPVSLHVLLHGVFLSLFSVAAVVTISVHDWPLVPKACFLVEVVVLLMKVHSYFANNRRFMIAQGTQSSQEEKKVVFPSNVSFSNFLDFLLIPTLVYELSYPRTEKIRWNYLFEKIMTGIGICTVLHVIVDVYITPTLTNSPNESTIFVIAELIIPFTFCYLLQFYIVFDCICNAFAEVTKFGDRLFYDDWWNSTTMDEFARNWNRPVHLWLQRHIYLEAIDTFKLSKANAIWITFLFSGVAHELLMILCFKMFRPWLFVCQMAQVPMIIIGRNIKGTRFGNCFFWFGIVLGIPLLCTLYCREYYLTPVI